jgi:integrase
MGLTSKKVLKLLRRGEPGKHLDARGLYLVVKSSTSAHWERRYQLDGKEHYHGLGSAYVFGLAQARARSRRASELLADGVDPLVRKREAKAERIAAAAKSVTFGEAATDYFKAQSPGWGHLKHVNQWSSTVLGRTLTGKPAKHDYCRLLRPMPVQSIDTPLILSVLKPHWHDKPESMGRLRARIAAVLDFSKAAGYRTGDNPADVAVIGKVLPARGKLEAVNHFPAVPYREIPAFMAKLRGHEGSAARCLEFIVYSAVRSNEAREATWDEIDLDEALWTIPRERMKSDRDHLMPIAPEVVELLRQLPRENDDDNGGLVFVGPKPGKPLTDFVLMSLMRKLGSDKTVHGFRSSFSDWGHEMTAFSNHAIEISLAHAVGGAQERAYRRGPMLDKRRKLMEAWAAYCSTSAVAAVAAKVAPIPIRRRQA